MSDTGDIVQIGLTAAGAAIGFLIPGVGPFVGAQIGFTIGSFFNPTDLGQQSGPRLQDKRVQTSAYGQDIPKTFGKVQLAGNIIWAPDIIEDSDDEALGSGKKGKGGGGKKSTGTQEMFRYYANFAVMFCEGPVAAITRIWADDELIIDHTGDSDITQRGNINHRVYLGTPTQEADPLIISYEGEEHTPAYRHRVVVVFERLPIDRYGRRIPVIRAEIVQSVTDVFRGETVTTAPYNLFVGYYPVIDPLRYNIITGPSPYRKVDAINLTVIASAQEPVPGLAAGSPSLIVDVIGNVYVQDGNATTSQAVYRLSPDLVWTGDVAGESGGAGTAEHLTIRQGAYPRYHAGNFFSYMSLCKGSSGNGNFHLIDISPYTATGGANPTDMIQVAHLNLDNGASTILGGLDAQDCFMFPNGRIFILCSDDRTTPGNSKLQEIAFNGTIPPYTDASSTCSLVSTLDLTTYISGAEYLMYYPAENAWIIASETKTIKLDRDTGTVVTNVSVGGGEFGHGSWNQIGTADQGFWFSGAGGDWQHLDFRTMTVTETVDYDQYPGGGNVLHPVYDPLHDAIWFIHSDSTLRVHYLHRYNGGETTLRTVVSTIAIKAGYTTADYDMANLVDATVHGYTITRQMPARSALEPLARIYSFQAVESDGKIKFVTLGTSTITATLTEDDLGAHEYGQEPPSLYSITRTQDTELPLQLNFGYSIFESYEVGNQTAQRNNAATDSENLQSFEAPIVLTEDEARQFAEKMLWRAWQNRNGFAFATNSDWLKLDPTDVINLQVSTAEQTVTHQVRITEQSIGQNGLIQFKAVSEDASVFAIPSTLVGAPASAANSSVVILSPGPTYLFVMDMPPLADTDNSAGYYTALAPLYVSSEWDGAAVYQSTDLQTWGLLYTTTTPATMGRATGTLASTEHWTTWREDESVTVRLTNGSLSSKTEAEVLNGANMAVLGDEVIQFQYASAIGMNEYKLSRLLRARKGTEWAVGLHVQGERFVYLNADGVRKINDSNTNTRFLASRTVDWPTPDAPFPFTNTQKRMTPFAPCDLQVGHPVGTADAHLTWKRRTRIGGEWNNGTGTIPLVDDDDYEVEIFSSILSSTVVRTIAVSAQASTVYTSAMQLTDFGATQAMITFRVFQMNDTVGRGIPSRRKTQ